MSYLGSIQVLTALDYTESCLKVSVWRHEVPPTWCFLRCLDRSCHVGSPGVTFRQTPEREMKTKSWVYPFSFFGFCSGGGTFCAGLHKGFLFVCCNARWLFDFISFHGRRVNFLPLPRPNVMSFWGCWCERCLSTNGRYYLSLMDTTASLFTWLQSWFSLVWVHGHSAHRTQMRTQYNASTSVHS